MRRSGSRGKWFVTTESSAWKADGRQVGLAGKDLESLRLGYALHA